MYKLMLYLLLLSTTVFSQTIDFQKALDFSIKNSKKIKQQKLNIEQKNLDIKKVNSYSYGKIDLSHEISRTNHAGHVFNSKLSSRQAAFEDFGFSNGMPNPKEQPINLNYPKATNNFNTKITYDVPLFTGFKLSNQEDILSLQKKAEQIQLSININDLSLEVLKAYNNAVVAKMFVKASKDALKAVKNYEYTAKEFHKEGLVTKIDKKQALVKLLNTQSQAIKAQNNFELSLAYLSFLTSIENISDVKGFENYNLNAQKEDLKTALDNRNIVKIMKTSTDIYKKNISLNKASYYPQVYSHVEYGLNDDKITLEQNKDYYMAVLGIKITLFDQSRQQDLEKSKILYQKSLLQKQQLEDNIKLQLKEAKLNLNTQKKVLKEKQKAKELSYEVLEQSKLLYKNKLISMSQLLEQEAIFRQNEANLILAQYENSLAKAKYSLALGNQLFKGQK